MAEFQIPVRARENPFRAERVEALAFRLKQGDRSTLLARFESLGCRAALVGPKGSGKTTLLGALEADFRERGLALVRLRFNDDKRRPSRADELRLRTLGAETLVTIDGAELLSFWTWRRLSRAARGGAGLLITLHRPRRLPTLYRHRTDADLLSELVARLIERELDDREIRLLAVIFQRYRGNLRLSLRECYDRWSRTGSLVGFSAPVG